MLQIHRDQPQQSVHTPNNQLLNHVVAIALQFKLCSTRYTVLQTQDSTRSASAITVHAMPKKEMHSRDTTVLINLL